MFKCFKITRPINNRNSFSEGLLLFLIHHPLSLCQFSQNKTHQDTWWLRDSSQLLYLNGHPIVRNCLPLILETLCIKFYVVARTLSKFGRDWTGQISLMDFYVNFKESLHRSCPQYLVLQLFPWTKVSINEHNLTDIEQWNYKNPRGLHVKTEANF